MSLFPTIVHRKQFLMSWKTFLNNESKNDYPSKNISNFVIIFLIILNFLSSHFVYSKQLDSCPSFLFRSSSFDGMTLNNEGNYKVFLTGSRKKMSCKTICSTCVQCDTYADHHNKQHKQWTDRINCLVRISMTTILYNHTQ